MIKEILYYAKNWYKKTDPIEDLARLLHPHFLYELSINDLAQILLPEVRKVLDTETRFIEFIFDLDESRDWRFNWRKSIPEKYDAYLYRVVVTSLSVLALQAPNERMKELWGIELSEEDIDYSILSSSQP